MKIRLFQTAHEDDYYNHCHSMSNLELACYVAFAIGICLLGGAWFV